MNDHKQHSQSTSQGDISKGCERLLSLIHQNLKIAIRKHIYIYIYIYIYMHIYIYVFTYKRDQYKLSTYMHIN